MTISQLGNSTAATVQAVQGTKASDPAPRSVRDTFDAVFDASQIMKELDTDGDGQVSDQEFAFYRAQKQARGEFVPAEGPRGNRPEASEQVDRATVDELLKRL